MSLVAFCRYWNWTPRQVDELTPEEYRAFTDYALRDQAEQRRANRKRGR